MILYITGNSFNYELENVARMFVGDVSVVGRALGKSDRTGDYAYLKRATTRAGYSLLCTASFGGSEIGNTAKLPLEEGDAGCERKLAEMLYLVLQTLTGKRPAWGIITGIRPAKFAGALMDGGLDGRGAVKVLREKYLVKKNKAQLCVETALRSREFAKLNSENAFSLYVSIPFCPTRCRYCSFISRSVERDRSLMEPYLDKLLDELRATAETADSLGLKLRTVYVGGGTPTSLDAAQLGRLCAGISKSFDIASALEYTVEAGRPDTIGRDKLDALKKGGVTRISINPQTKNDEILRALGRSHGSADVERAFADARDTGFDNINADLIAGLSLDTADGFESSLRWLEGLGPEGITVHALTLKRAADLREDADPPSLDASQMVDFAYEELKRGGWRPYYMYKQKGTVDSLENVGYSKEGREGLYNIFIMDELHTILGCGAGAVSKLKDQRGGLIKRIFNYKYPSEYISGFGEVLGRKKGITDFYEAIVRR